MVPSSLILLLISSLEIPCSLDIPALHLNWVNSTAFLLRSADTQLSTDIQYISIDVCYVLHLGCLQSLFPCRLSSLRFWFLQTSVTHNNNCMEKTILLYCVSVCVLDFCPLSCWNITSKIHPLMRWAAFLINLVLTQFASQTINLDYTVMFRSLKCVTFAKHTRYSMTINKSVCDCNCHCYQLSTSVYILPFYSLPLNPSATRFH